MGQSRNEVTRPYAGTANLPTSDRHRLLAKRRRRVALEVLADRTAPVDLDSLATAVAAREGDGTDEATVKRVGICLHHNHLPMLAEFGVIDYDPASARVESCPRRPEP